MLSIAVALLHPSAACFAGSSHFYEESDLSIQVSPVWYSGRSKQVTGCLVWGAWFGPKSRSFCLILDIAAISNGSKVHQGYQGSYAFPTKGIEVSKNWIVDCIGELLNMFISQCKGRESERARETSGEEPRLPMYNSAPKDS